MHATCHDPKSLVYGHDHRPRRSGTNVTTRALLVARWSNDPTHHAALRASTMIMKQLAVLAPLGPLHSPLRSARLIWCSGFSPAGRLVSRGKQEPEVSVILRSIPENNRIIPSKALMACSGSTSKFGSAKI